ncbi:MAG: fibronectin type III domain-containing protein, partial [Lentisphaeraceae bacterium]|nr:fibronectin type III domain-containing protein [Lentisphaeraceae bacterium]
MKHCLCLLIFISISMFGESKRHRVIWQENPESKATIMWDQSSGSSPKIYYDKLDHGQNSEKYTLSKSPESITDFRGMDNAIVHLTNLEPDTNYYFVIKDSRDTSERFFFRTAS